MSDTTSDREQGQIPVAAPAESDTTAPGLGGFRIGYQNATEQALTTLPWVGRARPDWLRLRYLKNGAGIFSVGDQQYKHWFDGLAFLKQFDIGDDITFRARFLQSKDYRESERDQRVSYTEFATAPDRNLLQRLWCTVNPTAQFGNNLSINLHRLTDQPCAIGDLPKVVPIDPDTLATGDARKLRNPFLLTSTPHPQRDERRGLWYNAGIGLSWRGFGYNVYSLSDSRLKPERVVFIPRSKPAYMHSIGMTENHIILAEHPMFASLLKFFLLGWRNQAVLDAFGWDGDAPMTLFIVSKSERRVVRQVEVPARFYFHFANAFDDGDDVVIDLCTYPNDNTIRELFLDFLRGPNGGETAKATLLRYRVNLTTGASTELPLTDVSAEFPRVNPRNEHRSYEYTYAVGINPAVTNDHSNQLVKVNVTTGETQSWYEPGCYPNEPEMVPRPGATREDDGVVLSVVLNANVKASMLLILDAQTFTEIGRAQIPAVLPFGLHGHAFPLP